MRKDKRSVTIKLNRRNGKVESGSGTCPAGNSAYYHHVMKLLFEFADYSLHQSIKQGSRRNIVHKFPQTVGGPL